jgi:hypothetical protein
MKINILIAIITSFLITNALISCGKKDSNSPKAEQISSDADKRILGVWDFHKFNIGDENYVSNYTFEFKKDSIISRNFVQNTITKEILCNVEISTSNFYISKDTIEFKEDLETENDLSGYDCVAGFVKSKMNYFFESDDILVLTFIESNNVIKINRIK